MGYLSLARRGRRLEAGEEPVGALCRAGHARLVVLAEDASPHTLRRAESFVSGTQQPLLRIPCTKEALGAAIGRSPCAIAAFTDPRLALAFVQALEEPERCATVLERLTRQSDRAAQRQREERAHRRNVRHGKK